MLVRAKADGGLAVPDLLAYYITSMATKIYDCFQNKEAKLWVKLENALSKSLLSALLWIPLFMVPKSRISKLP